MKALNLFAAAVLSIGSIQAQAIEYPGRAIPLKTAELKMLESLGFENTDNFRITLLRKTPVIRPRPSGMGLNMESQVADVDSSLLKMPSGPSMIRFEYDERVTDAKGHSKVQHRVVNLDITAKQGAGCGSIAYSAQLPGTQLPVEDPRRIEARFNLTLIDHSTRVCEDFRPFLWEVSIRQGYGWCGTMDARAELGGNPESVYTIQTLE